MMLSTFLNAHNVNTKHSNSHCSYSGGVSDNSVLNNCTTLSFSPTVKKAHHIAKWQDKYCSGPFYIASVAMAIADFYYNIKGSCSYKIDRPIK